MTFVNTFLVSALLAGSALAAGGYYAPSPACATHTVYKDKYITKPAYCPPVHPVYKTATITKQAYCPPQKPPVYYTSTVHDTVYKTVTIEAKVTEYKYKTKTETEYKTKHRTVKKTVVKPVYYTSTVHDTETRYKTVTIEAKVTEYKYKTETKTETKYATITAPAYCPPKPPVYYTKTAYVTITAPAYCPPKPPVYYTKTAYVTKQAYCPAPKPPVYHTKTAYVTKQALPCSKASRLCHQDCVRHKEWLLQLEWSTLFKFFLSICTVSLKDRRIF